MRHSPRQSRWTRWLVALLAADVALALVFGGALLWRAGSRTAGEAATRATPSPTLAAGAPAPTTAATPAPAVASPSAPPPTARSLPANPLISRGKPAFASRDVATPGAVVDGQYCGRNAWRTTTFPAWLSLRIGAGPSRLLLSWNGADPDNYVGDDDAPGPGIPVSYTIETSGDSTNGANGTWQTVANVRDNTARTRAHSFSFAGASWVRMTVTGVAGDEGLAIDEIDVHDISAGSKDTVFFMGDSITAASFLRCDRLQPSYAALVHDAFPAYFPALIDGGVAGVSSDWGVERIDRWLADNPDYQVWAIAYGTNDAYRERPSDVFERQMQELIDKVKAAGKEPVLARIPYMDNEAKDEHVQRLNAIIDQLTTRNGLRPGPDLYTWFKEHPNELASDGIHPTTDGSLSINRLWYEALRDRYDARAEARREPGDPVAGQRAAVPAPGYVQPATGARSRRATGRSEARSV